MPGNNGKDALTQFMRMNSEENSPLPQMIYRLRQYFILSIAEIITGFWEKKQLRALEVALFSLIQEGHNAILNNYSKTLLSSYLRLFRRNLVVYFGIILFLNITKSTIRCLRNMVFNSYNGEGELSLPEQKFDQIVEEPGANTSQFDNDRSNLPKIAKTYYGLTLKIINIGIDIYIFSSLLSPFSLLIVLGALTLSSIVTSSLSKPAANAKGSASAIFSVYTDMKNIITNGKDISAGLREYIEKKKQSQDKSTKLIVDLLETHFDKLIRIIETPQGKEAILHELSKILATRTKENLRSKMIDIVSDGLNKLIEKALSCLMLFLCGIRVIANKAAPGIIAADMVWLTATLKTTSDANKTFLSYIRAIKDYNEMKTTLDRIITAYPEDHRDQFSQPLFTIPYLPNSLHRLCLYTMIGLTMTNLYLGSGILQPVLLFSQTLGAQALKTLTFAAVISTITTLTSLPGKDLNEKIAKIDGRILTSSLFGLLCLHSLHLLFSINSSAMITQIISMHASYTALILQSVNILPVSLALPVAIGSYLLAGMTLYALAKKCDQYLFQPLALLTDITTIFITQTIASICFIPEYLQAKIPSLRDNSRTSKLDVMINNFVTQPILTLIILGLFVAPQLFLPTLGALPKSVWLTALLLPLVGEISLKSYLKNISIALLVITLSASIEYAKLYLPLLMLTASSILMMPLAMLSAMTLNKLVLSPTRNTYVTQIEKLPEAKQPKLPSSWHSRFNELVSPLRDLLPGV